MLIKDILLKEVIKISPDTTWLEAIRQMKDKNTNGLFVVDNDDKYLGVVTIAELISHVVPSYLKNNPDLAKSLPVGTFIKLCEDRKNDPVKNLMNTEKIPLKNTTKIIEVVVSSLIGKSYRMPVVDEKGRLIGAINRRHIKDAISKHFLNS